MMINLRHTTIPNCQLVILSSLLLALKAVAFSDGILSPCAPRIALSPSVIGSGWSSSSACNTLVKRNVLRADARKDNGIFGKEVGSNRFRLGLSSDENRNEDADSELSNNENESVQEASLAVRRSSWLSWWAQVILTTTSAVTLFFAKSVMSSSSGNGGVISRGSGAGLYLAGSGIVLSFLSIIWTWGGARLSNRLIRRSTTPIAAANMIRRNITIAITLNLLGMFITLIGAEQIVGILAAKVLTNQNLFSGSVGSVAPQILQPLDILVVQANTNMILSHFCSLFLSLNLIRSVCKLDPPSTQNRSRIRES